jgi:hypothetical protein
MPDPDPDPPASAVNAAGLSSMLSSLASAGSSAVADMTAYEQATPPADNTDVCAGLAELEGQAQSLLDAIKATRIQLGCNEA